MRKLPLFLIIACFGCAVDDAARREEAGRGIDPLVRERTIARMNEISGPARTSNEILLEKVEDKDCDGVCEASREICSRSARVCVLSVDYPKTDDEVHETCDWVSSDCDESRGLCANCGGPAKPDDY